MRLSTRVWRRALLVLVMLAGWGQSAVAGEDLLLLKRWHAGDDVRGWLMSEKLDGVRAYWDGHALISRGGHRFAAPDWFVKDFPPFAIDGELWSKRGDFEQIVSIVRRQQPHTGWRQLTFNIFEVPHQPGGLLQRLAHLQDYLAQRPNRYIRIIPQQRCKGEAHLKHFLQSVLAAGGEGVVVRRADTPYVTGRSADALKVKNFDDAECMVTGYLPGKGKFTGMTGALRCRMDDGAIVSIGSGLSQAQRQQPPAIGSRITFKFYGRTRHGKPRHPVFLRERPRLP